MGNTRAAWKKAVGPPGAAAARAIAVLLIICLVECASGSCLSYGHSCWGAHGKRSGQVLAPYPKVPDWYLMRLLRRMSDSDLKHVRQPERPDSDLSAIFQSDPEDNSPNMINNADLEDMAPMLAVEMRRRPEAIPMLDDDSLEKTKFMQLMRGASVEK